jgi:hypothetical protein
MVELSMTFHTQVVGNNGQPQAMSKERVEGLAEIILSGFEFGPEEEFGRLFEAGYTVTPADSVARWGQSVVIRV